jgi:hypothetical protein
MAEPGAAMKDVLRLTDIYVAAGEQALGVEVNRIGRGGRSVQIG